MRKLLLCTLLLPLATRPMAQTNAYTFNNPMYAVVATSEARFGENNVFEGAIGVRQPSGRVVFKKGSQVRSPLFVKANEIVIENGAVVENPIQLPANDVPNVPFYAFAGNTGGLNDIKVTSRQPETIDGNFKKVVIEKGVWVALKGSLYQKIEIEEGATVVFLPAGDECNVEEMVLKGSSNTATNIIFVKPVSVRIKNKMEVGSNCRVNPTGQKVNFYMGDEAGSDGECLLNGENIVFNGGMHIKKGMLTVKSDNDNPVVMKGLFVAEKITSDKKVIWQK